MVLGKLSTLSLLGAVATTLLGVSSALDDYAVPAVDFPTISSSADSRSALLSAMQKDGIVALQNVPSYAALRAKYLAKAASCAVTAKENKAEFLLYRQLTDGTKRFTISTESGRKLRESGKETLGHCPGYLEVYQEFNQLVEDAVSGVGRALEDNSNSQLSLEMHTDNGLLIAMMTPEYFDVADSGEVRAKHTRSEDAGLVIQTSEGKTVRPVLKADELILMLGSGVDQWIKTSPKLHPVMHGMRFPRGLSYADADAQEHKVLRAWFGKMILLKSEHVMQNTGMSYDEYANHTTRYLMETSADLDFAAVTCPPDRRRCVSSGLAPGRIRCQVFKKDLHSESGFGSRGKPSGGCAITCNHAGNEDDCAKYCTCEDQTVSGTVCWTLCVAALPEATCVNDQQQCNGASETAKLALVCIASTATTTGSASSSGGNGSIVDTPTATSTLISGAQLFFPSCLVYSDHAAIDPSYPPAVLIVATSRKPKMKNTLPRRTYGE